jgi:hypothetical protein
VSNIFLKPTKGRKVRMPERSFTVMPPGGASVPQNSYYASLIRFGDVEKANKTKKTKPSVQDNVKEVN